MKFAICLRGHPRINAIDHASNCLADELVRTGHDVQRFEWADWAPDHDADVVVVPYNPFMYGRYGFAPRLVWRVAELRRRPARVVLFVHEGFVPVEDVRSLLMGAWQRLQLVVLARLADVRTATTQHVTRWTSRFAPTTHLPIGSNVPDLRHQRDAQRASLGIEPDQLVVATLSTGHPSHVTTDVAAALAALHGLDSRPRPGGRSLCFLQLGAGAADVEPLPNGIRHIRPGELDASALARHMAAADLALLPFADGASTKRGSLMCALQHSVAVVSTETTATEAVLVQAALGFVPAGDTVAFAERCIVLATDLAERRRVAEAGRRLYDQAFDWATISSTLLALITRLGTG